MQGPPSMETVFWCWPLTILVIAGFPGVQGPGGPLYGNSVLVLASDGFCRSGAPGAPGVLHTGNTVCPRGSPYQSG